MDNKFTYSKGTHYGEPALPADEDQRPLPQADREPDGPHRSDGRPAQGAGIPAPVRRGPTRRPIAAYCEIEPATVGSILLRMEDAGLILRRQKAGNRRSLYVSLTEKGREAADRAEEIFRQFEADVTRGLAPEQVQTLQQLLSTLYDCLQAETKKERELS